MSVPGRISGALTAYAKAVLRNALIVTLLYIVGFAIAGVPWWLLVGLICGALNVIPQIGSVIALGLVLLVQLFATHGWNGMIAAGAVWLAVQTVEGFVLSPHAAGRAGVNPLLSIALVLVAGIMFGPVGAILVVPVVAVLLIVWKATRR
jgi:predicted PurR-regulated permease PerM